MGNTPRLFSQNRRLEVRIHKNFTSTFLHDFYLPVRVDIRDYVIT